MSDVFEKAKNVGGSVLNSAKNIGNSLYNSTKEQSELASLNVQKSVIERKLNDSYEEIGRRYVEYIEKCEGETAFEVSDVLEKMKPELEKLAEVKGLIVEKELQIKQNGEEKARKKAQDEFDAETAKLDRAIELDIISEEEYQEKLAYAERKLENYEMLRKIEMQLKMGIITREEYKEKVNSILG